MYCRNCGTKYEKFDNVCPKCHKEKNKGNKFCSECGAKLAFRDTKICPHCGHNLDNIKARKKEKSKIEQLPPYYHALVVGLDWEDFI